MITMLDTIAPRSDQLNADDFLAENASRIIKITKVNLAAVEQPCSIFYEGDNGKPYKPGLSMRRVLVHCWGGDTNSYIGRSLELYRDPKVTFGGTEVGGIRISKMSHIKDTITVPLTASRKIRKPFTVQPLVTTETPAITIDDAISDIATAPNIEGLEFKYKSAFKAFKTDEEREKIKAAKDQRKTELTPTPNAE